MSEETKAKTEENPIDYTEIVREITKEKFDEIFSVSSRKAREAYFVRHGIKKPKASNRISSLSKKNSARTAFLFDSLSQEVDDEMVEEILRTYLLSKRQILSVALDHLKIEHDGGLTESDDVSRFKELDAKAAKALAKKLGGVEGADEVDVLLYLKFMGVPAAEKAVN